MKNTIFKMKMDNDKELSFTLNYLSLYKLSNKNRKLYLRYNEIVTSGIKEEIDNITILYVAYCCANIESENLLTFENFLEIMPIDREQIGELLTNLWGIKKIDFRSAFIKATKSKTNVKIKVPKFTLTEVEDYYTYYVLILGLDESLFWYADISFLKGVSENYDSYNSWLTYCKNKIIEDSKR